MPSEFSTGRVFLVVGTAHAKTWRYDIQEVMSYSLSNGGLSPLRMSRRLWGPLGCGEQWAVSTEGGEAASMGLPRSRLRLPLLATSVTAGPSQCGGQAERTAWPGIASIP